MSKKCLGCGSMLQSTDKDKLGYIREDKLGSASFCERCFKITNYGKFKEVKTDGKEYIEIFKNISKTNDLVLYLADIFNLNDSINMINKLNNKVVLVITKYDIIPKSVKYEKLISKIKEYNLSSNIIDIIIVSSKNNYNIDRLYNMIYEYKTSNNVYITGNTNAGKSTLINKLLYNYSDNDISLTTSILPSTTINVNEVRVNNDLTIIDTPGFIEKGNISNFVDSKMLKKIMPSSEIRPITYQISEGTTLLIDKLLRIEYVKGEKNSFTFYLSNDIIVDRINTITNTRGKDLTKTTINVSEGEDVVVNGLCFIKITKDALLDIYVVDNVEIYKRKSLI